MTWNGRPRSLRATHRVSAFLVALLWCAAPVLAVIHASAEAHRYCAEHGAVEEGGGSAKDAASSNVGVTAAIGGAESAPSHDGCAFARFCRYGQVLGQIILEAAGDVAKASIPTPALVAPAPSVAVIVIAPKTSPPV